MLATACYAYPIMHMTRTTIMLPPDLKLRAEREARRRGISLGQILRHSLETELRAGSHRALGDSFFADAAVYRGKVPRDLSTRIDEHISAEWS